jgi:hypothetical protein
LKKLYKLLAVLLMLGPTQVFGIGAETLSAKHQLKYPVMIRVYFDDTNQIQIIADNYDVWTINPKQKFAVIQVLDEPSYHELIKLDLTLRLDHKLMQQNAIDSARIKTLSNKGVGIPGFACYSTVAETLQKVDQLNADYPDLVEIIDIGDSWEKIQNGAAGEDLQVIKITNENIKTEKPILFMASSIHAREYATAELNTRFAQYMIINYGIDADVTWILDHHEIHLSLVTNPDGRKQAQTGILWRKNTNNNHCTGSNNRGVDLNRNYPYQWAIGGSNSACSEVYYGPSEASEPEISAQIDYLRNTYDDNRGPGANDAAPDNTAGIFVDIHSYSQLVLWPWGYTNAVTANDNQLQALGKRTALFNQYRPQPVNDLVITGGGSIDAIYGELGVASLAFELGTAFFQDCPTFESQIMPDNLLALLYLARVTQAPYTQPLGPDIENLLVIPNVIVSNTTVQVSGIADDDRYNQSNGAQAFTTVQAVKTYINELPIESNAGIDLAASDGSFNSSRESFTGDISTNNLTVGKHLLYVQASDDSYDGATYAQFIDVVEAQNVATLSGTVINALTGLPIENALLNINQSQALSDINGSYTQYIQAGIADLSVQANGYADFTLNALNLIAGDQLIQDIELQPFCDLFADDVEQGNIGWQADSPWAISTDQSNSPTHAWTDSPGGQYNDSSSISLISPDISVSDVSSVEISYMSLCDTEAGYDFGYFEIQFNNEPWQEISRCDNQSSWQAELHQVNLPVNTSTLKLRFRLTTDDFVTSDGWHIDDVRVKASGAVCNQFFNDVIFEDGFE